MENDFQTVIFTWFAKNSRLIISIFHYAYYFGLVILVGLAYLEMQDNYFSQIYEIGKFFGQSALLLLGIVVLPGILGRFRIEIKLTRIITLLRRQLGITVFLLAFSHYSLIKLVPTLSGVIKFEIPYPALFENLGALALFVLFLLFVTSNNASKKILGVWWTVLHRFVYLAIWILVLHVGLQEVSIWALGIFTVGTLEIVSWVYYFLNKPTAGTASGGDSTSGQNQGQSGTNVVNPL